LGGLAADRGDLQAGGAVGQAAALPAQAGVDGVGAVAARDHQPVEAFEVGQGVIEGPPIAGGCHHQGRQVDDRGPRLLEQAPGLAGLALGPGHADAAPRQG
jgi:hypothetical protein